MTPEQMISEYARMASTGLQFRGLTILEYKPQLIKLVARTGATTILDYGSGQGEAWPRLAKEMGLRVTKYDPAIPRLARKPPIETRFDGVTCIDVLEHVPEQLVDQTIADLFGYASKFLLVTTCPRPAKKFFADTVTNLHVTQRPADWWLERLHRANLNHIALLHRETP